MLLLLNSSLAFATIFILLTLLLFMMLIVFFLLKYQYENVALKFDTKKEEITNIRSREETMIDDIKAVYQVNGPPMILYENECDELPDYPNSQTRSASPLPSYDDVIYCDQVNRSFQNLLSTV
ncbi:unnamed protein product, partial [Mesorhabditis belari]|uniref:Uncharacterized protein n=1 Tax=Mesorhabditis belari TaxID=2138241 RepID=A0AAF3F2U1_9BILA